MAKGEKVDDVIEVLRQSSIFGELPDKRLEKVRKAGKEMIFRPGDELAVQGESGDGRYFLIVDGEAELQIDGVARRTLSRGEDVGEISLIDGGPRSATVRARTDVRTFSLSSWNFRPLLADVDIATAVVDLLCKRIRSGQATADHH